MHYTVRAAATALDLKANWSAPAWASAETLEIRHFRPESSDHRPQTSARLLYDAGGIHGVFQVQDRYVRCVRTEYLDEVWKDSCVEFFAQPRPDRGYFNFEFNCGGAFLCSYITNPERTPGGFKEFIRLPAQIGRTIQATLLPTARILRLRGNFPDTTTGPFIEEIGCFRLDWGPWW